MFFDATSAQPLVLAEKLWWTSALEAVRRAPSAVNKQPWRVYAEGAKDCFHFYIKGTSMVDIGIAMSHFELAAKGQDISGQWIKREDVATRDGLTYIMTWVKQALY